MPSLHARELRGEGVVAVPLRAGSSPCRLSGGGGEGAGSEGERVLAVCSAWRAQGGEAEQAGGPAGLGAADGTDESLCRTIQQRPSQGRPGDL